MKAALFVVLGIVAGFASVARAATLTITPDKQVYTVGEQIVLNVVGDPQGERDNGVSGRFRFESELASHVSSEQSQLTSLGGAVSWAIGALVGGPGFADAFLQIAGGGLLEIDAPLTARVTLVASAPGTLHYSWDTTLGEEFALDFFSLQDAPGGSVLIVPEPATGPLIASGIAMIAGKRRVRRAAVNPDLSFRPPRL